MHESKILSTRSFERTIVSRQKNINLCSENMSIRNVIGNVRNNFSSTIVSTCCSAENTFVAAKAYVSSNMSPAIKQSLEEDGRKVGHVVGQVAS